MQYSCFSDGEEFHMFVHSAVDAFFLCYVFDETQRHSYCTWYGMVWYGRAGSVASDYHGGSPGASWTAAPAAGMVFFLKGDAIPSN